MENSDPTIEVLKFAEEATEGRLVGKFPREEDMKIEKTRKSVETNGLEFLFSLLLIYPEITAQNWTRYVINDRLQCNSALLYGFIADLCLKSEQIPKFITNFRAQFQSISNITYTDIRDVYLTGKKNTFPEIDELNAGIDPKTAKADVYFDLSPTLSSLEKPWIGFSVKQSKDATKSNYSVHKLIPDKLDEQTLCRIKQEYLSANGFATHEKQNREKVNRLFHVENPYFEYMKLLIDKHREHITSALVQHLCCVGIPYSMFEFDGTNITKYDGCKPDDVCFVHEPAFYFDLSGKPRKCAKLFYRLSVLSKTYRVEIRWKGNVHCASPQFQLHEI